MEIPEKETKRNDAEKEKREKETGMKRIKVIIKRPDEKYGHVTNISDSLENLQKTVGGPIEIVSIGGGAICICNEEGKIRGLEKNFIIGTKNIVIDRIVGTAIIAGSEGPELADCPLSFDTWKKLLENWGN